MGDGKEAETHQASLWQLLTRLAVIDVRRTSPPAKNTCQMTGSRSGVTMSLAGASSDVEVSHRGGTSFPSASGAIGVTCTWRGAEN